MNRIVSLPVAIAAIIIAAIAGGVIGLVGSPASDEVEQLSADGDSLRADLESATSTQADTADELASAEETLERMKSQRDNLRQRVGTLEDEAAAVDERKAQLDQREKKLDERQAGLDERESAIQETETAIEEGTFGNGIHVVGEDIAAGEYRTDGGDGSNPIGCYYAFLSDTGADPDLLSNNIVTGSARVSLTDGDVFESAHCTDWQATS